MITVEEKAFRQWNECVAAAVAEDDVGKALAMLASGCRALMPADAVFAAVYGEAMKPVSIFEDVPRKNRFDVIESYIDGAYLLDPFYRAGIDRVEAGLYHVSEVGPPGFEESEFFRRYYRESSISDEIGFLTYLDDGCFANFSLVKLEGSDAFPDEGVHRLRLVQAVVHQVLVNCWKELAPSGTSAATELHTQLEDALTHFGNSVLTHREAEVIRLYLKGHSTASITERLGISYHTVSTHRKSAYQKLDINSQGELFHLFIDSLSCFDPVEQRDPLRGYLSVSR